LLVISHLWRSDVPSIDKGHLLIDKKLFRKAGTGIVLDIFFQETRTLRVGAPFWRQLQP